MHWFSQCLYSQLFFQMLLSALTNTITTQHNTIHQNTITTHTNTHTKQRCLPNDAHKPRRFSWVSCGMCGTHSHAVPLSPLRTTLERRGAKALNECLPHVPQLTRLDLAWFASNQQCGAIHSWSEQHTLASNARTSKAHTSKSLWLCVCGGRKVVRVGAHFSKHPSRVLSIHWCAFASKTVKQRASFPKKTIKPSKNGFVEHNVKAIHFILFLNGVATDFVQKHLSQDNARLPRGCVGRRILVSVGQ